MGSHMIWIGFTDGFTFERIGSQMTVIKFTDGFTDDWDRVYR